MNVIAPGVLVLALAFFTLLFRREACPERRRHWWQVVAISGLLLIAAIGRAVIFGARSGDCGLELIPSVSARSK